jgi:glycerol-3-phosphate acyltransferase PlsY
VPGGFPPAPTGVDLKGDPLSPMNALIWLPVTMVVSYLVGSIPFGYVVARLRGVNIFAVGSGNIGATNVGRVLGRKYGVLVFLLDFAKGALPVQAALHLPDFGIELPPEWLGVAAGFSTFLGHLFPVYLGFRGGKGVATGAGIVVVLVPWPALAAVCAWAVVVLSSRYVSAASVVAAVVLAGVRILSMPAPWYGPEVVVTLFCALAASLVIVRHLPNLRRLWSGTENKIKESDIMLFFSKMIHVLALGLWFGMVAFFTLAGALIFDALTKEAEKPEPANKEARLASDRPLWFPVPEEMKKVPPSDTFPSPLRKEQGTRAAGVAVSPLFPWYYGTQVVCAVICALSAVGWCLACGKALLLRVRAIVLVLALVTVGAGWWLEDVVTAKRVPRNELTDKLLTMKDPGTTDVKAAEAARAEFGMWHGFSLIQNFTTLLLVAIAMSLAASMPVAQRVHRQELDDAEQKTELMAEK